MNYTVDFGMNYKRGLAQIDITIPDGNGYKDVYTFWLGTDNRPFYDIKQDIAIILSMAEEENISISKAMDDAGYKFFVHTNNRPMRMPRGSYGIPQVRRQEAGVMGPYWA